MTDNCEEKKCSESIETTLYRSRESLSLLSRIRRVERWIDEHESCNLSEHGQFGHKKPDAMGNHEEGE